MYIKNAMNLYVIAMIINICSPNIKEIVYNVYIKLKQKTNKRLIKNTLYVIRLV